MLFHFAAMPTLLLARLQFTLTRLQGLNKASYSWQQKQALRAMLSATITDLFGLYPDHLSLPQRHQLLQNLAFLEQEFLALLPTDEAPLSCWQTVHESLLAAIETTLTAETPPHS